MKLKLTLAVLLLFSLQISISAQALKKTGDTTKGQASYYHSKFHGRKTASGEKYDEFKLTAAHKTLPYGTMLKVTNTRNNKSVTVKVNDRGPYSKNRIVDLSFKAASQIDMIKEGVATVNVEILSVPGEEPKKEEEAVAKNDTEKSAADKKKEAAAKAKKEKEEAEKAEKEKEEAKKKEEAKLKKEKEDAKKKTKAEEAFDQAAEKAEKTAAKVVEKVEAVVKRVAGKNFKAGKSYSPWGVEKSPRGYGIQIAAYYDVDYAQKVAQEAIDLGLKPVVVQTGWQNDRRVFRVIYGENKSAKEMRKDLKLVKSKGFPGFLQPHFKK